ncbi:hypothetical protein [Azospirillum endophyticum]
MPPQQSGGPAHGAGGTGRQIIGDPGGDGTWAPPRLRGIATGLFLKFLGGQRVLLA